MNTRKRLLTAASVTLFGTFALPPFAMAATHAAPAVATFEGTEEPLVIDITYPASGGRWNLTTAPRVHIGGPQASCTVNITTPNGFWEDNFVATGYGYYEFPEAQMNFTSGQKANMMVGCTVIDTGEFVSAERTFDVLAQLWMSRGNSRNLGTFYPAVKPSSVYAKFSAVEGLRVTAAVKNTEGKTVRSAVALTPDDAAPPGTTWEWNGKNNAGKVVPNGKYTIVLTGTDMGGTRTSLTWDVTVATQKPLPPWRTRKVTTTGNQSKLSASAGCFVLKDNYNKTANLDCWTGKQATATYVFKIPKNAKNLKWNVRGTFGCCDQGTFKKVGTRISPTKFRVTIRVGGMKQFTVKKVNLSYRYRPKA